MLVRATATGKVIKIVNPLVGSECIFIKIETDGFVRRHLECELETTEV